MQASPVSLLVSLATLLPALQGRARCSQACGEGRQAGRAEHQRHERENAERASSAQGRRGGQRCLKPVLHAHHAARRGRWFERWMDRDKWLNSRADQAHNVGASRRAMTRVDTQEPPAGPRRRAGRSSSRRLQAQRRAARQRRAANGRRRRARYRASNSALDVPPAPPTPPPPPETPERPEQPPPPRPTFPAQRNLTDKPPTPDYVLTASNVVCYDSERDYNLELR